MGASTSKAWYLDTSVLIRAMMAGASVAALEWFNEQIANGSRLVSSTLLALECQRAIVRQELRGEIRRGAVDPDRFLRKVAMAEITARLVEDAAHIQQQLRAADAIHVATALMIGVDAVIIVTHDAEMASSCRALGFEVLDPVTDDEARLRAGKHSPV